MTHGVEVLLLTAAALTGWVISHIIIKMDGPHSMRTTFRNYWPLRHPLKPRPYLVTTEPVKNRRIGRIIVSALVMLFFAGVATWIGIATNAGYVQEFWLAFFIGAAVVAPILIFITPSGKPPAGPKL